MASGRSGFLAASAFSSIRTAASAATSLARSSVRFSRSLSTASAKRSSITLPLREVALGAEVVATTFGVGRLADFILRLRAGGPARQRKQPHNQGYPHEPDPPLLHGPVAYGPSALKFARPRQLCLQTEAPGGLGSRAGTYT